MKTIIVHIPMGCEDTRVIKKVDLVDGLSATIEVTEEQDDNRNAPSPDEKKVFFCYQDKVKTRLYPTAYAFLETTSNHYVRCHPVNKNKGVLDIFLHLLFHPWMDICNQIRLVAQDKHKSSDLRTDQRKLFTACINHARLQVAKLRDLHLLNLRRQRNLSRPRCLAWYLNQ